MRRTNQHNRHHRHHRHHGFTLVELSAACAISAVLMAAVLAIFTGISRDRERLGRAPDTGMAGPQMIELLRADLAGASDFKIVDRDTLLLQTSHSLDETLSPTDRPSAVAYRTIKAGDMQWLVREQELSDEPAPRPLKCLVAANVLRLQVTPINDGPRPRAASRGGRKGSSPRQNNQVTARRFHVQIGFEDPSANIDQIVCVR